MADREYKEGDEMMITWPTTQNSPFAIELTNRDVAVANAVRAEVLRGLDAAAKACGGAMTVSSTITEKGAKTVWRVDPSATHEEATGDTLSEAILKAAANRSENGGKE